MNHRYTILALALLLSMACLASGQETAVHPAAQNVAEMKFGPVPGFPTCASGSVQNGDPTKGPSIILGKLEAGCSIPWHWHTPSEHLMMVTGTARAETKDGKPFTLRAGGFALMPSHHVHQFRCTTACTLYVYSDTAFDIHYVDAKGSEISPGDALKVVKETATNP
jgi:quercetin dioxygenase-like cupin family protein